MVNSEVAKKSLAVLFMLVFALLAGCSPSSSDKIVQLQFMHGWGGDFALHATMRDIYSDFNTAQTGIRINMISAPDSDIILSTANDMLAVGLMPDIIMTSGTASFVRQAARMGSALDLMPYIEADEEFKNSIDPLVIDTWRQPDGSLYTITDSFEVQGYWYNEAIWRAAGVMNIPTTWSEFWEMCESVNAWAQERKNGITVFALEKEQLIENLLLARLSASEKGRALASAMPKTFDQAPIRDTLSDIQKAFTYSRYAETLEDTRRMFQRGEAAVYCNGMWEYPRIMEGQSAGSIRYANYPTNDGYSLSYLSPASGYVLYKSGSPAKEQSGVEFLKYMLSVPQQTRLAREAMGVPCNPNVDTEALKGEQPLFYAALEAAKAADLHIISIDIVWEGYVIDALREYIEPFAQGKMSVDEIIAKLNEA